MNHRRRNLLRLAVDIHGLLTQDRPSVITPCWPTDAWQRCQDLVQRMERAQLHGWLLAADRLRQELAFALALLRGRLTEASECLQSTCEDRRPASPHDLYEDILALEDEFEEVTWNRSAKTLSVITDPVELEQIDLGRFEICLDWSKLAVGSPYRVIAREPEPAASDQSVTHPHVSDEHVCEGDAQVPLRCALAEGRLTDFFLIVASLLHTYNPSSPYVALSDWHGVACSDCDTHIDEDERSSCEQCGSSMCEQCYRTCGDCDGILCTGCISMCTGCQSDYCASCLKSCRECNSLICPDCRDKQERCETCHDASENKSQSDQDDEQRQEEQPTDSTDSLSRPADPPLQPDRLGQVAVPA
jgi:hypothetical protein